MGTLLALLGSLGFISSGATTTTTTILLSNEAMTEEATTTILLSNEAMTEAAIEGGILAESLETTAKTLGVWLAISVIYGGYYVYSHWGDIKHFISETQNRNGHYVQSATVII